MLVKMTCASNQVYETIEYAESQGLQLQQKIKLDKETVELLFTTNGKEAAVQFSDYGAEAFLQFEDGTTSPLYVRRDRDFSE